MKSEEILIQALHEIANWRPHKEAALEMKKIAKKALANYRGTCGFCEESCKNDWCPSEQKIKEPLEPEE